VIQYLHCDRKENGGGLSLDLGVPISLPAQFVKKYFNIFINKGRQGDSHKSRFVEGGSMLRWGWVNSRKRQGGGGKFGVEGKKDRFMKSRTQILRRAMTFFNPIVNSTSLIQKA